MMRKGNICVTTMLATIFVGMLTLAGATRLGEHSNDERLLVVASNHPHRELDSLGPTHTVPFDASAFDYVGLREYNERLGNCPDSEYPLIDTNMVMDGKIVSDPVCIDCGALCYIRFTEGGEYPKFVYYRVSVEEDMMVDFTFCVASRRPKMFQVEVNQLGIG